MVIIEEQEGVYDMGSVKCPDGYLLPPFCQEKTEGIELLDEAEFNCQVSNNLQLLCAYRALTQSQLADFLQCERSSYSYCEAEKQTCLLTAFICCLSFTESLQKLCGAR